MKNKENKSISNKPKLVLNDATKFYLATQDLDNEDGLFVVASLFCPRNGGQITVNPITEVAIFENSDAAVYYSTALRGFCEINKNHAMWPTLQPLAEKFNIKTR